jgi:predicted  nucleic acid-binding Zn-ribbon protein
MNEETLRQEITLLQSQLRKVSTEKHRYEQTFRSIQDRIRSDVESSLYLQAQSYEARLTELHSVIGVLKQRVDDAEGRRIQEVDEGSVTASEAATGTEAGK